MGGTRLHLPAILFLVAVRRLPADLVLLAQLHRLQPPLVEHDPPTRSDGVITHEVLSKSYWSPGLPRDMMEKAINNSLCFGLYEANIHITQFHRCA